MNEYVLMWKKWNDFDGKSGLREYWMAVLINFIVAVGITIVFTVILDIQVVSYIYSLAVFIPGLSLLFRRLHDTDRSAINILWLFLPIAGPIILLVFLVSKSK